MKQTTLPIEAPAKEPGRTPVFRVPLILAGLGVVGLLAALLGDGVLDALSWLGLGIPVALCLYKAS